MYRVSDHSLILCWRKLIKLGRYDWLVNFDCLKDVIKKYVGPEDSIFIPGCGNSLFSFDLYDNGFQNTISVDNSGKQRRVATYENLGR